jgi:hypothetical protein
MRHSLRVLLTFLAVVASWAACSWPARAAAASVVDRRAERAFPAVAQTPTDDEAPAPVDLDDDSDDDSGSSDDDTDALAPVSPVAHALVSALDGELIFDCTDLGPRRGHARGNERPPRA